MTLFRSEHLIVIGRGRMIADTSVEQFVAGASRNVVRVRSPELASLTEALAGPNVTVTALEPSAAEVGGVTAEQIGDAAAARGIALHELTLIQASLEEAFMEVTQDALQFHSAEAREVGTEVDGAGAEVEGTRA